MAVVIVTGGSSGIGLATVRRLAAAGDRVFAASRKPERAELPAGVTTIVLDVADPDAAAPGIARVVDEAGRVDALVNNAGTGTIGPMEEVADDVVRDIFETNVFGPLRLARAALPVMREQASGRIVNVTSMNDSLPAPFAGHYSASKAALASASLVLDAEVRRFGITVSVVAPGLFRSEMTAALGDLEVPAESLYRRELEALLVANRERVPHAADPDIVAAAIEACIHSDDPPARVVVGADAQLMMELVRSIDTDALAARMRDVVRNLGRGEP